MGRRKGGMGMRVRVSRRGAVMGVFLGGLGIVAAARAAGGFGALAAWLSEMWGIPAAVLLHELGHLAAARLWGVRVDGLRLDLLGARLSLRGTVSYGQEMAVAAGGPAVNLLTAVLAAPAVEESGGAALLAAASVCLGLVNLLPVAGLDGGRLLSCAVSLWLGPRAGDRVLRVTTAAVTGGLWLLSVYGLLRAGQLLTLFGFSLCLLLFPSGDSGDFG
jgi:stage IV sporulation protein FB